jgi:hypothetical protein
MSVVAEVTNRPLRRPRRKVVIRRDGKDFVIALHPDNIVIYRNAEARALRKACSFLRWEVVSDVALEPNDPATW